MKEELIKFEICSCSGKLSIYMNEYRIAGEKPWGGGKIIETFNVPKSELLNELKEVE